MEMENEENSIFCILQETLVKPSIKTSWQQNPCVWVYMCVQERSQIRTPSQLAIIFHPSLAKIGLLVNYDIVKPTFWQRAL